MKIFCKNCGIPQEIFVTKEDVFCSICGLKFAKNKGEFTPTVVEVPDVVNVVSKSTFNKPVKGRDGSSFDVVQKKPVKRKGRKKKDII